MTGFQFATRPSRSSPSGAGGPPPLPPRMRWWNWFRGPNFVRNLVVLMLALGLIYGAYWWLIRRVVVPPGEVLADPARDERGPLPIILQPGRYNAYANPYAYEIKQVDPIIVEPGHRGVVTLMAGNPAKNPNQYLVGPGEQGVQRDMEPE